MKALEPGIIVAEKILYFIINKSLNIISYGMTSKFITSGNNAIFTISIGDCQVIKKYLFLRNRR
jgi:hypothetical protein